VYSNRSLEKITVISVVVISILLLVVYRSLGTVLLMLLTVGIELQAVKGVIAALVTNDVIDLSSLLRRRACGTCDRGVYGLQHLSSRSLSGGARSWPGPRKRLLHYVSRNDSGGSGIGP